MTFTNLELLRLELADPIKQGFDKQFGDGETVVYKLAHSNIIEGSLQLSVDDAEVADEDYEIDLRTGVITFDTAPANDKEIEAKYQFTAFSDEELNNFLALDGNSIPSVMVRCIDILLIDAAKRFDYSSGQTEMKASQVFQNLKDLREVFAGKVSSSQSSGGAIKASRTHKAYQSTARNVMDLSRADLGENE